MTTLAFDDFWSWLVQHPNCVVRVASAEAVLYDDDDLHWYLGPDGSALMAQSIRGKRPIGEIVLEPERVSYVQDLGEERQGEFVFELISETETERSVAYYVVMAHGLDEGDVEATHGPAVH